jgi:methionyl-tRNA formyltransferase
MKILFFGTPDFSVPTLKALLEIPGVTVGAVITQPDRPAGRGGAIKQSPIKEVAISHNIPVFQPTSLRKEFASLRPQLEACGPFDLGIVIAFGQILPKEVLEFPSLGCVNIHASLLPRWRGAAPIQRALQAGDAETGVCLMKMDEGLDTGAVYSRATVAIEVDDTGGSLHDKLAELGAQKLVDDLQGIASGELNAVSQPVEGITYAAKIKTEECKIHWALSAKEIALAVRAFSPFPGAFTMWHGKRLKILFAADARRHQATPREPGTILNAHGDRIEIACGSGTSLLVSDLQLEGKRRMGASEFLRGNVCAEGDSLT